MGWLSGHLHEVFPFMLVLAKKSFNIGLCAQSSANSVDGREEVNLFFCTLLSNATLIHKINTHGLSDNVSYCIPRGWRSVLIVPQREDVSDFLLLFFLYNVIFYLQVFVPPSLILHIPWGTVNLIRDTFWFPFAVSLYEAGCSESFSLQVFPSVNLQNV